MSVPTHKPSCRAVIQQTTCWDCGRMVWYFDCSCGSKVLFDDKGPPWPEHKDSCPVYEIRRLWQAGWKYGDIKRKVHKDALNAGARVPEEVFAYLKEKERAYELSSEFTVDILPTKEPIDVTGRVTNLDIVDFNNKFRVMAGVRLTAMLRQLGSEPYIVITLRELSADATGFFRRYIIYAKNNLTDPLNLRVNTIARITLTRLDVGDEEHLPIWIAKDLSVVNEV